jgi:hypothetical protein
MLIWLISLLHPFIFFWFHFYQCIYMFWIFLFNFVDLLSIFSGPAAHCRLRLPHTTRFLDHTTTRHSLQDSSGRVISSSQRPLPDNSQYTKQTNILATGWILIHDQSRRAAVDLRLRSRGHWDRQLCKLCNIIFKFMYSYFYFYVYVFLFLCMFRFVYSASLWYSVYCLCVNVYCTAVLFVCKCVLYCCTVCV